MRQIAKAKCALQLLGESSVILLEPDVVLSSN